MKLERMMGLPVSRQDFERNMFCLLEQMKSGRLRIASGIRTDDYLRIRKLPNGRLELSSINETVRLEANMMAHLQISRMLDRSLPEDEGEGDS